MRTPKRTSVGNLLLHLNGNVRQWIISGFGGATDSRERSKEFAEKGPHPSSVLLARLERTLREAAEVIEGLDPDSLLETRRIQGCDVDGVRILVHVVEHFSYHVGQITIAVGTALTGGPPHRSQRALLTHWAPTSGHDAQSLFGVRVQNTNRWKPAVGQTVHALPGHPVSLAPLP